jgi:hypothetical protein
MQKRYRFITTSQVRKCRDKTQKTHAKLLYDEARKNHGNQAMTKSVTKAESTAQDLLELHLQHEMAAFDEASLLRWFAEETDQLLVWSQSIRLDQLVTADTVKAFIQANLVTRDVPAIAAEIAEEASTWLISSQHHLDTPLGEIIDETHVEDLVARVLEIDEQLKGSLNLVTELPIYRKLLSEVIYQAIIRYIYDANILSKSIPGVSALLKMGQSVVSKTTPSLSNAVEKNVRSYISKNLDAILLESEAFLEKTMTNEAIEIAAMEFYEDFKDKPLGELQESIDNQKLSHLIQLVFGFWEHFRHTAYFKNTYELIVDYFFEKYGGETLDVLLDNLDISSELLIQEFERFSPQLVVSLKQSGQLEAIIRRRLSSFYTSPAALDCLRAAGD